MEGGERNRGGSTAGDRRIPSPPLGGLQEQGPPSPKPPLDWNVPKTKQEEMTAAEEKKTGVMHIYIYIYIYIHIYISKYLDKLLI